jgi:hypothetical protein
MLSTFISQTVHLIQAGLKLARFTVIIFFSSTHFKMRYSYLLGCVFGKQQTPNRSLFTQGK